MTAHDHPTYVQGCYRCELSRDEARSAMDEQIADEMVEQGLSREQAEELIAFARRRGAEISRAVS